MRSVFDPDFIEQELKHEIFDPSGLFQVIGNTLMSHGHCRPGHHYLPRWGQNQDSLRKMEVRALMRLQDFLASGISWDLVCELCAISQIVGDDNN
jgi:hypothetical protein